MIKKISICIICTLLASCQTAYVKTPFVKPAITNDQLPIDIFRGKEIIYNNVDGYFFDMQNAKIMAIDIANYQTMRKQCSFNNDMWNKAVDDYNLINK